MPDGRGCSVTRRSSLGEPVRRTNVALAWVAFHWRRVGIGAVLVRHLAEWAGVAIDELAWEPGFSREGAALACRFAGPDGGVWIA